MGNDLTAPGSTASALTQQVIDRLDGCPDPRLRELVGGVIRHVHAFAVEQALTEPELMAGIRFLTEVGLMCTDRRQEFILLSDVLGASMQTITVNNEAYQNATEATVFGPFFVEGSPEIEFGGDIAAGASGEPCWVEGTVTDTGGKPVPRALIEVWGADEDGFYDVQYDDGRVAVRGHLYSDAGGRYRFWGVAPTPYPIPHDGPVGRLLAAAVRSPMRAAHLHFMVKADGFRTLVTHIFVRGDELLDHDSVFGVRDSLVMDFQLQPAGTRAPDGRDLGDRAWSRVRFDIVLAPAAAP